MIFFDDENYEDDENDENNLESPEGEENPFTNNPNRRNMQRIDIFNMILMRDMLSNLDENNVSFDDLNDIYDFMNT